MDVSIIIVNYNTWQDLRNCLDSLYAQTKGVSFEVIVVDNCSNFENIKHLRQEETRAKIIYNKKNSGFGIANNIGITAAKGDYLFLLNSDTILQNNAIKIFFDKMKASPKDVACLGCYLFDEKNEVTHSYGRFPTIQNCLYKFVIGSYARYLGFYKEYENYDLDNKEKDVEYITGAALFIRREITEQFGYFDSRYFLYYEETDMLKNYAIHGLKCRIINDPKIQHLCGKSSSNKSYAEKQLLPMMSHFVYLKKWNNYFVYILYKIIYIIIVSLNIIVLPRRQRDVNKIFLKAAFLSYPNHYLQ